MPSKVVTSHTTAQVVAAERKDCRWKLTSLIIDNAGGGADRTIQIVDSFTPSITNGVPSPVATTVTRFSATVVITAVGSYNKEALEGIVCLGALTVLGDAIDAGCNITVGYEPN